MREIKFRSWLKEEKRMFFDFNAMAGHPIKTDTEKAILMQCTGLKDSLDKEIYEGDILCDCLNEISYEVIWDDYGMFLFRPIGVDEREQHPIDNYELDDIKSHASTIVVGNIYENPELLEDNQCD